MKQEEWKIYEESFDPAAVEQNGSRYLIANGYMGYRGTLEEFRSEQLVALNLAGLFDQNGDAWRESVNAPNPLYTVVRAGEECLTPFAVPLCSHTQALDIRSGIHSRKTVFQTKQGNVTISANRFISMHETHILAMEYTVCAEQEVQVTVRSGIDYALWDINGPHLKQTGRQAADGIHEATFATLERGVPLVVYDTLQYAGTAETVESADGLFYEIKTRITPAAPLHFYKICGVYWGETVPAALPDFQSRAAQGYARLLRDHMDAWEKIWEVSDIRIAGDTQAQFALRYSLYHLNAIAPKNAGTCSIPARGLSGQVYKGAAFWDTEMFMLPFFSFTRPEVAQGLLQYRLNTLPGARRKAEEYGFNGAFYAWESQESGDDACTLFNITDVFTGRPMRTYFRDKQIHVSADIAYALWDYCTVSGDYAILPAGGLEMLYQCALFYYSYAYYKPTKHRFEILDVVGPDEYHERVNNNAYTNRMVKEALQILRAAMERVKADYPDAYRQFISDKDLSWLLDFAAQLYVPQPDAAGVIEQFDGYYRLEDVDVETVKKRVIEPNEYWGCGHGLATTTRVLKQADVVMLLNIFRGTYSQQVLQANWNFYEPYTEHGSSLSACAYAIVAAKIGYTDWARRYFMKTASVDYTGNTRQYLGTLYIGGTHPAANGGSWNTAVFGFAGVSYTKDVLDISPHLPQQWDAMEFSLLWQGVRLHVSIKGQMVEITAEGETNGICVTVNGKPYVIE